MKFFLLLAAAVGLGSAIAYGTAANHHGSIEGRFGPFSIDGELAVEDALAKREAAVPNELPQVTAPNGSSHDFGVMRFGQKGDHSFVVKNIGTAPLTLKLGATTCKCTLGSLKDDRLMPGAETEIKLEWKVQARNRTFEQTAEVITNDPTQYALQFKVTGKIARDLYREPDVMAFGDQPAGERIEESGTFFSYLDEKVRVSEISFKEESLDALSKFEVEEVDPSGFPSHSSASQAFQVKMRIEGGLRQGNLVRNLQVTMEKLNDAGEVLLNSESGEPESLAMDWQVVGKVVGTLGVIPGPKLKGQVGGGWIYDFGKLAADDELSAKMMITLKGEHRRSTKLSIGGTFPEQIVEASLDEPTGQGSMSLIRMKIQLNPAEELTRKVGKTTDDYGWVLVNSDNPSVPPMKILLKFVLPSADERAAAMGSKSNDDN